MAEDKKGQPDNQSSEPNQQKPGAANTKVPRNLLSWLVFFGLMILLVALLSSSMTAAEKLTITSFETAAKNEQIKSIIITEDGRIEGERVVNDADPVGVANPPHYRYGVGLCRCLAYI